MALAPKFDRVYETTVSQGTGDLVMGGAAPGFQTWAAAADGSDILDVYYTTVLEEGDLFEVGQGRYLVASNTFQRQTCLGGSNYPNFVNWPAGTKGHFLTPVASEIMFRSEALEGIDAAATRANLELGTAATKDEGAGSGLDADFLDGQHASAFQLVPTAGTAYVRFPTDRSVRSSFYMATAPLGWERVVDAALNDNAVRIVTSGGGTSQTTNRSGLLNLQTEGFSLALGNIPDHNHQIVLGSGSGTAVVAGGDTLSSPPSFSSTESAGSGLPHAHQVRVRCSDFLLAEHVGA